MVPESEAFGEELEEWMSDTSGWAASEQRGDGICARFKEKESENYDAPQREELRTSRAS